MSGGRIEEATIKGQFAALDTTNGKVLTKCRQRHRNQEYLSFLRGIEKKVPKNLQLHIIVDNPATHKSIASRKQALRRRTFSSVKELILELALERF